MEMGERFLSALLTRHFYNLLVRYKLQIIEYTTVFRQIFISALLLFTPEYGAVHCWWRGEIEL